MAENETLFGYPVKEVKIMPCAPLAGRTISRGWCDFCGFETDVAPYKADTRTKQEQEDVPIKLCEICASSILGNCLMAGGKNKHLFQALAYVTNMILKEIRS